MAGYGLRNSHVSCLYYLYIGKNLTATDLCERCEEDKATISRTLDFLETNGYILERPKNAKRYKAPLKLTEKGVEVAKQITSKIEKVLSEINEAICDDERTILYRNLSTISDCLERCLKTEEDDME